MNKCILTLLFMFIPYTIFSQVSQKDKTNRLSLSFYGGASIPVNGNISSTVKTTDYLNTGPQYGFGASYYFTKSIGVEINARFNLNFNKKNYRLNGKHSGVYTYSYSINGIYNLGYLLKDKDISPYVKAGIGVYKWKHLDDSPWDEGEVIVTNGYEYRASSFGFNAAAGVDYFTSKHFSIGLLLDYNMYFPKDEDKFGEEFSGQGNFTPQLKLTYYLPAFK